MTDVMLYVNLLLKKIVKAFSILDVHYRDQFIHFRHCTYLWLWDKFTC